MIVSCGLYEMLHTARQSDTSSSSSTRTDYSDAVWESAWGHLTLVKKLYTTIGLKECLTSTPVVRTGVDPHMPIAVTTDSLQHWPSLSKQCLFLTRSATVGQVCRTGLTIERIIDFQFLTLGGLPVGPRSPKGEMTYYPPRSTTVSYTHLTLPTNREV